MDDLHEFVHWMAITHRQRPVSGGNGRLMYRCPAHDDRHRSLSVRLGRNGRLDFRCFAGCPTELVVQALGWKNGTGRAEVRSDEEPIPSCSDGPDIARGRELLSAAWVHTVKTKLTTRAQQYLEGRCIPWRAGDLRSSEPVWEYLISQHDREELVRCGLARYTSSGVVVPASALRTGRILIPYYLEGRIRHLRSRSVGDTEAVRYCGLPGWGSDVYIADAPPQRTVFVVEGEFKALLLRYYGGFPAVGLPGIHSAHSRLLQLCKRRQLRCIVLFDTEPQKPTVLATAQRLTDSLRAIGLQAVAAVLQDDAYDTQRIAPDDYLLQHGLFRFLNSLRWIR